MGRDQCGDAVESHRPQRAGATPRGLGVQNGCHWQSGPLGVAYDVLPQVLPSDQMVAVAEGVASEQGAKVTFKTVDLGGGHSLFEAIGPTGPVGGVSILLGDREMAILVTPAAGKDPGQVAIDVAKAFNAVSDRLPPAPKI